MSPHEPTRRSGWAWWLFVPAGWVVLILAGSFFPAGSSMSGGLGITRADLVGHFLAYAGFAATMYSLSGKWPVGARLSAVVLFPVALGGIIELLQPLVGRTCSWQDAAANTAGVMVGWAAGAVLYGRSSN